MRMYDIITKKRDGHALEKEEIDFFIKNYVDGKIPDYQASALLMAIYFQKMNRQETLDLTASMINSGKTVDLSSIDGIKIDKHSTGGVGDKTSLVVAPLVAATGIPVAKMSGRGLGYTGGTIDKLESFIGFSPKMTKDQFIDNVNNIKLAISEQTIDIVPADKKLYSLRDVTATVENISLIASSIMSKKLASGSDAIVLDVKFGSGAFMKEFEDAKQLAKEMVDIGNEFGKNTIAIITDMSQPLGKSIGNCLEVNEAIETLKGRGPDDLTQLSLFIGANMLMIAEKSDDLDKYIHILKSKISDGSGLIKLKQMIKVQSGDNFNYENEVDIWSPNLKKANNIIYVKSNKSGYIKSIKADNIGMAAMIVGAGRENKESKIDLSAGIVLINKVGDYVKQKDVIAEIHLNNMNKACEAENIILNSYTFSETFTKCPKLIKAIVTKDGTKLF